MSVRRVSLVLVLTLLLLVAVFSVVLNVPLVRASDTIYIRANGSIEGTSYVVSSDNITYVFTADINDSIVVERSNIAIDGAGYTLQGTGGNGFSLSSVSNVTIKNANIKNYVQGIYLSGSSNNSISANNITANNYYGI
jgi:parallel beta-helix repeat protein